MVTGVYPGSFDPLTLGHLDVIKRSARIVDHLIIGVLRNSSKSTLFSMEERVKMISDLTRDMENVEVKCFDGLLVDFVRDCSANVIVRGLRAITDFDYELQMAQTNKVMVDDIETIFLATNLKYSYLSSSMVKEIAGFGGDISRFVHEDLVDKIKEKYKVKDR